MKSKGLIPCGDIQTFLQSGPDEKFPVRSFPNLATDFLRLAQQSNRINTSGWRKNWSDVCSYPFKITRINVICYYMLPQSLGKFMETLNFSIIIVNCYANVCPGNFQSRRPFDVSTRFEHLNNVACHQWLVINAKNVTLSTQKHYCAHTMCKKRNIINTKTHYCAHTMCNIWEMKWNSLNNER